MVNLLNLVTVLICLFDSSSITSASLNSELSITKDESSRNPLIIYNQVSVNSLSSLNLFQSEFELDFLLFQRWRLNDSICKQYKDIHRSFVGSSDVLLQDGSESITDAMVLSRLWLPQTYLMEVKSTLNTRSTNNEGFVTIYNETDQPGCSIKFTRRLFTKVACKMDFREYPNDIQNCSLTFTGYFWSDKVLKFQWDSPGLDYSLQNIDQNHYEISFTTEEYQSVAFDDKDRTWLTIRLIFKRKITYFIYQAVIPSILIVASAYFSFFISVENGPNRFLFTATPFFALITLYSGVKGQLPPVSYINASDIWMLGTLIFDFSTICVMSYCCYVTERDEIKKEQSKKSDKRLNHNASTRTKAPLSRQRTVIQQFSFILYSVKDETLFNQADNMDNMMKILFPILFLTFNCVYWILVFYRRLLS
ncbi:gamma-aminobutyric acid receptor subunit alpha-2 [Tetranychus urticae]|uniref:Neurotransmitter-gated ion-channel ligand-binding domain-containing protein n=1 Tax=Tetranychus urticae TaxID=32264 RepID=T1JSE8_TETUR|nr:gamma-aminobutyric acid receptor subunit alpha-2 [Tetranychus urticae]